LSEILSHIYVGLYVRYYFQISINLEFTQTLIFFTDFRKTPQIPNCMKIHPVGAELLRADRQTDMTKL